MLSNPRAERVRAVASLARRATRERRGLFLVEGPQGVREAVRWRPAQVVELYATLGARQRHGDIVAAAAGAGVLTQDVGDEVMAAMSDAAAPQGLLAVCRRAEVTAEAALGGRARLAVLLAQVRDPGNAGTAIRAADAAGADAVLVSDASVDVTNPKAVRSSAGSLFHLPVATGRPTADLIAVCRGAGLKVYAADAAGPVRLDQADVTLPHVWVLGNEAWGLPDSQLQAADLVVRVPIYGRAESLNLAMAATVCLFASAAAQRSRATDESGWAADELARTSTPRGRAGTSGGTRRRLS